MSVCVWKEKSYCSETASIASLDICIFKSFSPLSSLCIKRRVKECKPQPLACGAGLWGHEQEQLKASRRHQAWNNARCDRTPSSHLRDVRFAQDSNIWVSTEQPGQPVPRYPRLHPTPANTRLGISLCQGMALPCWVPHTPPCLGDLCASLLSPQGHLRISCLKPLLIFLTDAPCYAVQHTPDKTKRTQSAT